MDGTPLGPPHNTNSDQSYAFLPGSTSHRQNGVLISLTLLTFNPHFHSGHDRYYPLHVFISLKIPNSFCSQLSFTDSVTKPNMKFLIIWAFIPLTVTLSQPSSPPIFNFYLTKKGVSAGLQLTITAQPNWISGTLSYTWCSVVFSKHSHKHYWLDQMCCQWGGPSILPMSGKSWLFTLLHVIFWDCKSVGARFTNKFRKNHDDNVYIIVTCNSAKGSWYTCTLHFTIIHPQSFSILWKGQTWEFQLYYARRTKLFLILHKRILPDIQSLPLLISCLYPQSPIIPLLHSPYLNSLTTLLNFSKPLSKYLPNITDLSSCWLCLPFQQDLYMAYLITLNKHLFTSI